MLKSGQLIKAQRAAFQQDRRDGRRHYTIRAIPYQEAERLKPIARPGAYGRQAFWRPPGAPPPHAG